MESALTIVVHIFLKLNKFLARQRQRFHNERGGDKRHTVVPSNDRRQTSMIEGYKNWSHGMINVSIPEVNMLKNSSTLAVSAPINLSIKLGLVSVNYPRKTYFIDELCSSREKVHYISTILILATRAVRSPLIQFSLSIGLLGYWVFMSIVSYFAAIVHL